MSDPIREFSTGPTVPTSRGRASLPRREEKAGVRVIATKRQARFLSARSLGSAMQCSLRQRVDGIILCNASASVSFDRLRYMLYSSGVDF